MKVDDIRQVFSKASIVLRPEGISALYTYKDGWVTQSVCTDGMGILYNLVKSSDRLGISYKAGNFVRFSFRGSIGGKDIVFYQPLSPEVSVRGLLDTIKTEESYEDSEFLDFFMGVDLESDDEIIQRFNEWVDLHTPKVFTLKTRKWQEYKQKIFDFAANNACECKVLEPDYESSGSVEVQFPEGMQKTIWLFGKSLHEFLEIIEESQEICIECNVVEGFLNITFFA